MFQLIYFWSFIIFGFNVCLCFEDAWYSFHSELKDANREELVVTNVTTDDNFKLDYKVKKWTSLSVGPICYSIGLTDEALVLLISSLSTDKNKFNITTYVKDLRNKPLDTVFLKIRKKGRTEIVIIVAYYEKLELEWYKIQERHMEFFGTTPLLLHPTHINVLQMKEKNVLLVANNSTTVNLYEFDVTGDTPYLGNRQSIRLSSTTNSSIFSNFEYDYYLSIPQKSTNLLLVYKFEQHQFLPYKNLPSKNLNSVVSFEIGFKSFLAIDGFNAGIYQFTRNGLIRENINNTNLYGISYWLPVPVNTYRDEVILFAQRTLDHGSHMANVIDIITYNGGNFEEHEDIPCSNFGEQLSSLTCLAQGKGITGSSYIAVDDKLALIVPAISNSSLLFVVHSTIKQVPNPNIKEIEKLIKTKDVLQNLIANQTKKYEELKRLNKPLPKTDIPKYSSQKMPQNDSLVGQSRKENLLQLNEQLDAVGLKINEVKEKVKKITEIESRKEFNTIIINGTLEIRGQGKFGNVEVDKINDVAATELLEDIVRKDFPKKISGNKTFTDLEVDKISFEKVNDIDASDIVSKEDSIISVNGNTTFKNPVNIKDIHVKTGKTNNILLEEEIVDVRKKQNDTLEFETVNITEHFQVQKINDLDIHFNNISADFNADLDAEDESETIFIPQNVTITKINGDNFEDFIHQLCLVNIKCYVPGHVKVKGNVAVNNSASTQYLNNLKFPEEYILKDSIHHSNITGKKTFKGTLTAKEIRCRGTVDGLDTKQLVTLSTNQEINGKLTFKDIQVTEALNVTGKILGEDIDQFLPNPTLENVDHVKSNVNFKQLEVEGNIIVENNLNSNNLQTLLDDLVYKDDPDANITSSKIFPEGFIVQNNLQLLSDSINNININSLVTKNTDQIIDIGVLKGDVIFENLFVNGTYDGINITQMDQDMVKLSGEQYISSTLIFQEDIAAEHFEITETLNDVGVEEYLYTVGDREVENDLEFKNVVVENILVEGDVIGNLSEIDLSDFSERYLSYSKEQVVDVSYVIKHSIMDYLTADYINDNDYADLFNANNNKLSERVKTFLENGDLEIEDLYVNGSLYIQKINDENINDVLPKHIFIDEDGAIRKNFSIQGDIYVDTIDIDKLSSVNWAKYVKELIFKDEIDPVLKSPEIHFTKGIKVDKLIETKKLNDIAIENVLTREGSQNITGDVIIKGNVAFKENVEVVENINELKIDPILKGFDITDGTYVILGDIVLKRLPHIYNLKTEGYVNGKNTTDTLSQLVYTDEDSIISSETSFENIVNISGNLAIAKEINNQILSEVVPQIVLITKDTEIWGPVTFSKPVLILKHLTVQDLVTNTLYGCDLNEWIDNAIFIDQGIILGNYTLENVVINGNLNTKFANDIDMNWIIPLRSDQSIDYLELEEATVVNDIPVGNLVNGFNLSEEYGKTVMANVVQEISTNIIFQNVVLVRENLTAVLVNDKEVSKIVTTNTDQNLTAVYNFNSKCRMQSDLHIYGLVNKVNASHWMNNGIRIDSPDVQEVYDDWTISKNFTFNDNIEGQCIIGDLDLVSVTKDVQKKRDYKFKVEYGIIVDYKNMCIDLTYLYQSAKRQIYKFQYLEELQTISFTDQVQLTHYFQYQDNRYLLVNLYNCSSQLLIFNKTTFYPIASFETGHIAQVISSRDADAFYLVTRSGKDNESCEIFDTNVWKFTGDNLTVEYNAGVQDLLQKSMVPGTFFTLNKEGVIEFKISRDSGLQRYRKWKLSEDNAAFVPRGLKTGLALRTGHKLIFLDRTDPLVEDDFSDNAESVIIGNFTEVRNHFLPGSDSGDLVVTRVGTKGTKRSLLAVATHEETNVRGRLDFIKIYEDALKGEIFHKVPAYKPSSLVSIEFDQGETLLAFMENERTLQVYEYKGIEGFKHRSSSRIEGSKLFLMTLPLEPYLNERKAVGIVHENKIRIIQSVMLGNKIRDDLTCEL